MRGQGAVGGNVVGDKLAEEGPPGGDIAGIVTTLADAKTGLTTLAVATADQTGLTTFGGISVGGDDVSTLFSPAPYLRLVILMILAFGLAFEFPVLLVFLQLARVLNSRQLGTWRRTAVVAIFVVAAVITPSQDPISLFAMAIPMYLLFEGSIILGRILKR